MRATLTFTADTDEILADTAVILNKRVQTYNESDTHKTALRITKALASVEQLPDILGEVAVLRTQLARLDFALEDMMKILSAYHQAMTEPTEETNVNNEV